MESQARARSWARAVVPVGAVVLAAAAFFLFRAMSSGPSLADPACPHDVPVMAFNVSGAIRRDDVAVTYGDGRIRRLTDDHSSWDPSFSPDGSEVAFTTGRHGSHSECCGFDRTDVYVMRSDGTRQRPLSELAPFTFSNVHTLDSAPAWSPDGESIAFVRDERRLMVAPAGGGTAVPVYEARRASVGSPVWSPDSARIAFTHSTLRDESIFVLEVETLAARPLAARVGVDGDLDWSPDGETVAFESSLRRKPGVYTVSVEDGRPELVAHRGYAPAWPPDGGELAYLADEGRETAIFVREVASDETTRVDTDGAALYSFERDLDWLDCGAEGSATR